MAKSILEMIQAKESAKLNKTNLILKDINRDLIVALTALPVYGKSVRDDDILTIIINGGVRSNIGIDNIKEQFEENVKAGKYKKVKGKWVNEDGNLILVPRV